MTLPAGSDGTPPRRRNQDVAAEFRKRASALEVRGDNPFRIRAYRKAADRIERISENVETLALEGRLREITGIGKDLANQIDGILNPGVKTEPVSIANTPFIETIRRITGLEEAAARYVVEVLLIRTLEDLERIIRSHLLKTLPGADLPPVSLMMERFNASK